MNPPYSQIWSDLHPIQFLYPIRLLHLCRCQALIEKTPLNQTLPISGERRRRNATHTKACAEAQAGGTRLGSLSRPPLLIELEDSPGVERGQRLS